MKLLRFGFLALVFFSLSLTFPLESVLAAVTFSLNPASQTITTGNSFNVNILLDTGGQAVNGAIAVLTYDPSKLSVLDANTGQVGTQITAGTIFTNALTNTVDTVVGKITLDYGSSQASFSGQGTFGTINFRTLAQASSTPVSFVLTGTTGTSAVYSGTTNVLSAATNGSYTISATGSSQVSTSSALPKTGGVEDTIFVLAGAFLFLSSGLILFKLANSTN